MPASLRFFSEKPRIAVNIAGSGEAIVFLHGVGTTRSSWDAQLKHFQATHCAVAWDTRGYGDSDDYEGDLDFAADFAGDLVKVLDGLKIRTAHVVGLSMGGLIAQCFYFAYPQRVATLVLAHTFPSFRALGDAFVNRFVATRFQPLLDGATPADAADDTVKVLLGSEASPDVRRFFHDSLCALRKESYVKALRGLIEQDAPGALEDIAVPTLVLAGEHDRLSPPPISYGMSGGIPGSQVKVIPNCGHLSNIERPAEFNAIVGDFIARHTGVATQLTDSLLR